MDLPERLAGRIQARASGVAASRAWIRIRSTNGSRAIRIGANSVVHGNGYQCRTGSTRTRARRGDLVDLPLDSHAFGGERSAVGVPPGALPAARATRCSSCTTARLPAFASLRTVLDNLIHRLEIPPMIVALTSSPDRLREYADDERHARFLAEELVPATRGALSAARRPRSAVPDGCELRRASRRWRRRGAIRAFFGRLLLQSGSFAFTDIGTTTARPLFDPVVRFVNAFRAAPGGSPSGIFVSCGMYESLIYYNRSLVPILQSTGMDVRFVEARDGTTGRTGATACAKACRGCSPGPLLGGLRVRVRGSGHDIPAPRRRLVARHRRPPPTWPRHASACPSGADICWPHLLRGDRGISDLALPSAGRHGPLRRRARDDRALRPAPAQRRYDLVIDRLTHWYQPTREWIKKATSSTACTSSTTRGRCSRWRSTPPTRDDAAGHADPETWMVPPKAYERQARPARRRSSATRSCSTSARSARRSATRCS
jgi:hypothetical protein